MNIAFLGNKCPLCGEAFIEKDDIVVCPECGTPQHRACYSIHGECANADKHSSGYSWTSAVPRPETKTVEKTETDSASSEREKVVFDNTDMAAYIDLTMMLPTYENQTREEREEAAAEKSINGVSEIELYNFFGQRDLYFINVFRQMATKGAKMTFNLLAGILSPYYQFFHRMSLAGLILGSVRILLSLPTLMFFFVNNGMLGSIAPDFQIDEATFLQISNVLNIFNYLMIIIVTLFNDFFYMHYATSSIKRIRALYSSESQEYYAALSAKGKSSPFVAVISILGVSFASLLATVAAVSFLA